MYRVDLNIDKTDIAPQHFINKEEQLEGGGFGEYTAAQFAVRIISSAITSGHPKGNMTIIRRTLRLAKVLGECANGTGIIELSQEDLKYLRGSFDKSNEWINTPIAALIVDRVYTTLEKAEEIV